MNKGVGGHSSHGGGRGPTNGSNMGGRGANQSYGGSTRGTHSSLGTTSRGGGPSSASLARRIPGGDIGCMRSARGGHPGGTGGHPVRGGAIGGRMARQNRGGGNLASQNAHPNRSARLNHGLSHMSGKYFKLCI